MQGNTSTAKLLNDPSIYKKTVRQPIQRARRFGSPTVEYSSGAESDNVEDGDDSDSDSESAASVDLEWKMAIHRRAVAITVKKLYIISRI